MQTIVYTKNTNWANVLARPQSQSTAIAKAVNAILANVQATGDEALIDYAAQFDKATLTTLQVSPQEFTAAEALVSSQLKKAIKQAYSNIKKFHKAQLTRPLVVTTMPGVVCKYQTRPIQNVGLYIPGGSAPLFSTVLMLGIPAQLAGCSNVVLCSPANTEGKIHPAILYTAKLCGITQVYKVGGAQAIAAMAFGTQSIAKAHKIFGPGNRYVTLAKQLVQQQGVAIDMPAGPSEVMVVADETAVPAFVAADLLSQAEHGPDSQVVLVAFSKGLVSAVKQAVDEQLSQLPRASIATQALENSKAVIVKSTAEALEIVNAYAPEHLIVSTKKPNAIVKGVINAGSIFVGNYSPESAGDYASGTNHTLPTNGYARVYGGVSVAAFTKQISIQQISPKGLKNLGPTIEVMAAAEGLEAHKNAVTIRLNQLKNKK